MPAHPAFPPEVSRTWAVAALLLFGTVVAVSHWPPAVYATALPVLWLSWRGRLLTAAVLSMGAVLSFAASAPLPPLPEAPIASEGVMATDVIDGRYGPYALIDLPTGPVAADLPVGAAASRGDVVLIEGAVTGSPGTLRGSRHRGQVRVDDFELLHGPTSPIAALGNAMRDRVVSRLEPLQGGRALLAGFLVGHTDGVDEIDQEAMRRAGLSHFTAVSGSNVALFLGILFVALGPIGVGPRRRAVVGLLGLPVFAAATRFEPSVLRASVMAGLGLGGRLIGLTMEAWQLFSAAVIGLLLMDPTLADHAGFQLSVAATAGVIAGARWPLHGGKLVRSLAVTIGAQAAVAPLLVLHFGKVPLLSPLVNLVAAPIVAVSTVLGAIGMVGPSKIATIGSWLAGLVLALARLAAGWPQIGWLGILLVVAVGVVWARRPRARQTVLVVAAVGVALLVLGQTVPTPNPGVVVLDVGQGDAILLAGGHGHFALVDGGPDPIVLIEKLRRYGVRYLELIVLTHAHADHAAGLTGVVGRVPVGWVWADTEPHRTPSSEELFRLLEDAAVPVEAPTIGEKWSLGELEISVLGPLRRYASTNDQSIVLMVEGPGRSMLLSGDIESVAQAELRGVEADVLKVPHHGAATSDPEWLKSIGSELAIISVGPNDFGHPVEWIVEALEPAGGVKRTDEDGDVLVPLGWETGPDVGVPGPGRGEAAARGDHIRDGRDQRVARLEERPHHRRLRGRGFAHGGPIPDVGGDPDRPRRPVVAFRQSHDRRRR
ncbi:MAG: ComEC/Rec2 family competence protein [Acidimicrobiia bacterium]